MGKVRLRTVVTATALAAAFGGGAAVAASVGLSSQRLTVSTIVATVPLGTCTLTAPVADTYGDSTLVASNFGAASDLNVRSQLVLDQRSFARFDIASCSIPGGSRIKTAALKLFLSAAPSASRTYEVHRVTVAWGETTLTWLNQPAVAGSATASAATGTTSSVTVEWNVAADVQAFVDGIANEGWRIKDQTEGSASAQLGVFSSREHATASQRPRLEISYYP